MKIRGWFSEGLGILILSDLNPAVGRYACPLSDVGVGLMKNLSWGIFCLTAPRPHVKKQKPRYALLALVVVITIEAK
ncbi:MAG: hypothetical protein Q7T89_10170 [Anaerolineales bacterium]|nr:hypothetical protein [Anaerolineales bacterium]